jgi:hypothetical protein
MSFSGHGGVAKTERCFSVVPINDMKTSSQRQVALTIAILAISIWSGLAAETSWIIPDLPKPNAEGWVVLFDGEHLYGASPTNKSFSSGKIFVQNGTLWMDSSGIPIQLKSSEFAVRAQVKKVSGQNFGIWIGRDVGWFNGGAFFGIGKNGDKGYRDLKTQRFSETFSDFFEMEFLATGGKLVLLANGKIAVSVQDEPNSEQSGTGFYAMKGISVLKRIEIKTSDIQSLLPKGESPASALAKPDPASRLKKLKDLYEQGLITKDDYDKKVKEIMDSL